MFCEQAEMLLTLLALDEIEPEQKAELLAHVDQCAACKEKLGDLRVTLQLLREAVAAQPAPTLSKERRAALAKAAARTTAGYLRHACTGASRRPDPLHD